jgi:hypothetical protein
MRRSMRPVLLKNKVLSFAMRSRASFCHPPELNERLSVSSFNQDAFISGLKTADECGEDYPAAYRKNIEEIFAIYYDAGLHRKLRALARRDFIFWCQGVCPFPEPVTNWDPDHRGSPRFA